MMIAHKQLIMIMPIRDGMGWGELIEQTLPTIDETKSNLTQNLRDDTGWRNCKESSKSELESMGIDVKNGSTGEVADKAKEAFAGRTLSDYYTEGQ